MKTKEKIISLVLATSVVLVIALQNPVLADPTTESPGPINETQINIELREYKGELIIKNKDGTIQKGTANLWAKKLDNRIRYQFIMCVEEDMVTGCAATPWSHWIIANGNDRVWIIKNANFMAVLGKERGLAIIKSKNRLTIIKLELV